MVATRRSLGGQPQLDTSPPAPPPSSLSRAQQAALKKLNIAGTDALKGDPKAAQAARDQVQTYHYRGAVYAADANTPSAWLENQPKRYLKRSRDVSSGAENGADDSIAVAEEEEEETARPAKRRSLPAVQSSKHNHKPETSSSARGKPRAGRGGRQSLPAKRKAAALDNDDEDDDNTNETKMQFDYASAGGQDDRVCLPRLPKWLSESTSDRKDRLSHRANPIPTKKSPVPNNKAMNTEIQRLKQDAKRKKYQVQPLKDKDLAHAQVVKLIKKQTLLKLTLQEWKQAKALLEAKKREAGLKSQNSTPAQETTEQPEETNYQPAIDLAGSSSDDAGQQGDDRMVDEQWEREQEQNRRRNELKAPKTKSTHNQEPEIPETSPETEQQSTNERPQTPASATPLTGPNALPHPTTRGYTPSDIPAATPSTSSTNRTANTNNSHTSFASLPPDAELPTTAADGNRVRWSIQRSMSVGEDGEERAEYAIDLARLEGESRSARRRRIERERELVGNWTSMTGGRVVERNGGR